QSTCRVRPPKGSSAISMRRWLLIVRHPPHRLFVIGSDSPTSLCLVCSCSLRLLTSEIQPTVAGPDNSRCLTRDSISWTNRAGGVSDPLHRVLEMVLSCFGVQRS